MCFVSYEEVLYKCNNIIYICIFSRISDETSNPPPSRECLSDQSSITVEITTIIALSSTAIKVSWEVHVSRD